MSKVDSRIWAGTVLQERLRSEGNHLGAETVANLIRSLRASRQLNSVLHADLQETRRRAGLPAFSIQGHPK